MLSKKNSMVTMVTDEFLENRIILQKSVATIGFIWLFWFQKCILLYIFVQVFLVMRCIRSHISFFRLGLTPTLNDCFSYRNIFQNGVNALSKMVLKTRFCQKAQNFVQFGPYDFVQISPACGPNTY